MAVKKWRGKWVVDLKIDGKRIRRVSPEQSKAGARQYEAELLLGWSTLQPGSNAVDGVAPVAGGCPTLAEFAPEWLVTYAVPNNKPSEQARKEMILRVHLVPFFGNRRLDEIKVVDVEAYKADRLRAGLKASTINRHLPVLQKLLRSAVEWGRMDCARLPSLKRLPAEQHDFDWLRPEEAARLLDAARHIGPKWHALLFVALRTGMRKGEIMGLHWSEVDFEQRCIMVKYSAWHGQLGSPKSGKIRVVPMTRDLSEVLTTWHLFSPGAHVFPGRSGGLMTAHSSPSRALDKALKVADLRHVRFHDLRHSFASHLVLKGRSLREIQLLLGHQSVAITERYAHVADEQLARAVDVLDGIGAADRDESEDE